jgi:hypothetical protein
MLPDFTVVTFFVHASSGLEFASGTTLARDETNNVGVCARNALPALCSSTGELRLTNGALLAAGLACKFLMMAR